MSRVDWETGCDPRVNEVALSVLICKLELLIGWKVLSVKLSAIF